MRRQFFSSLVSLPVLASAVLVIAYGLYVRFHTVPNVQSNMWDLAFPIGTETLVLSLIGLFWWLFFVAYPIAAGLARREVLLRHGSWIRATLWSLRQMSGALLAGALVLNLVVLLIAVPAGVSSSWSHPTLEGLRNNSAVSAFSSVEMARTFALPTVAWVATGVFTAVGYLLFALLVVAVSLRWQSRTAAVVAVVIYVWAALSSFGVASVAPALDLSRVISLGWSISNRALVQAGVEFGLLVVAIVVVLGVRIQTFRALASTRILLPAILVIYTILLSIRPARQDVDAATSIRMIFVGQYGDVLTYAALALIPLCYAGGVASRISDRNNPRFWYELMRRGSVRRWIRHVYLTEFAGALIYSVVVLLAASATVLSFRGIAPLANGSFDEFALEALLGLCLATVLQTALVVLIFITTGSLVVWLFSAGVSLILGYPLILPLGGLNVFAPYSTDISDPFNRGSAIDELASTAIAILIVVVFTMIFGRIRKSSRLATS